MIRVLHIIGHLGLGGAQVCLKQIVEHNEDSEIEHFIYPLRQQSTDIPINGTVIRQPYRHYDLRKFFAIFSLCKKYNINVIHAHLHKPVIASLAARYFLTIPVIVHEHGSIAMEGFQYRLYRFLLKLLRNKAALFIAVSNSIAANLEQYSKVSRSSITVVYNAVDVKRFSRDLQKRKLIREELGMTAEDIVVGYAGRLSYEKGPDILLEAFAALLKDNPSFLLVFAGDGPMKQSLHAKAAAIGVGHRVRFLGLRNNISDIMNIFDVGCIPSRRDAFGLAAVEMMSMEIPLVASAAGGLSEILTDRQNALVLKDNTPNNICQSILEVTRNSALRQQLAENASRYVQRFDIPHLIRRVNTIYRQTAKS